MSVAVQIENAIDNRDWPTLKELLRTHRPEFDQFDGLRTALHYAAEQEAEEAVQQMLDAGCDPNISEKFIPVTPLDRAAATGRTRIIELLIARGARIQHPSSGFGGTLIASIGSGSIDAVECILAAGGSRMLPFGENRMLPYQYAITLGHSAIAELLRVPANDTAVELPPINSTETTDDLKFNRRPTRVFRGTVQPSESFDISVQIFNPSSEADWHTLLTKTTCIGHPNRTVHCECVIYLPSSWHPVAESVSSEQHIWPVSLLIESVLKLNMMNPPLPEVVLLRNPLGASRPFSEGTSFVNAILYPTPHAASLAPLASGHQQIWHVFPIYPDEQLLVVSKSISSLTDRLRAHGGILEWIDDNRPSVASLAEIQT